MASKYNYHAKAVAVAGALTRPLAIDLGEMAKTELIQTEGGYHSSRLENHRVHELFSIGSAYTQVVASEGPEGHFNTLAIATIENLNVLDLVKIERLTARLVGHHRAVDFETCEHPWVIPMGSTIENLRIAGRAVQITPDGGFTLDFDQPHSYDEWKKTQHHYATPGHAFQVPGFGSITCRKLEVLPIPGRSPEKPHRLHRLAMLSLDLGSPVHGHIRFAMIDENGSPPKGL